ncbi:MAG TPA: hypothetical protein PLU30_01415 [Verrucomicrobiae bacterium]|nr:hypothetical protein [Verrucomicrobiae bacterium]
MGAADPNGPLFHLECLGLDWFIDIRAMSTEKHPSREAMAFVLAVAGMNPAHPCKKVSPR